VFFAFLSPLVGWFGVAVTGTDAGSNALFGKLQVTAAQQLHASPILFGAANTSGGVMAKMISPQNLAWALESMVAGEIVNQITVPEDTAIWARVALDRMLEIK